MSESHNPLPSYDEPPVIETVLGVEFEPIGALSIPHLGIFWERIRSEYPRQEIKSALPPTPGLPPYQSPPQFVLDLAETPELRLWASTANQAGAIQLQNNRFVSNWRKVSPEDAYPRYVSNREVFVRIWNIFERFLDEESMPRPVLGICEVSYVNHLELGREVQSTQDLTEVFPWFRLAPRGETLPPMSAASFGLSFPIGDGRGALSAHLQQVIRTADLRQVFQLTLTAKGKAAASNLDSALEWLDTGHEWIVRGFTELTSEEMHRLWRRRT